MRSGVCLSGPYDPNVNYQHHTIFILFLSYELWARLGPGVPLPQIPFRRVECSGRHKMPRQPFIVSVEVLTYLTVSMAKLARSKEATISYACCADKFKDGAKGKGNNLGFYGQPGSPIETPVSRLAFRVLRFVLVSNMRCGIFTRCEKRFLPAAATSISGQYGRIFGRIMADGLSSYSGGAIRDRIISMCNDANADFILLLKNFARHCEEEIDRTFEKLARGLHTDDKYAMRTITNYLKELRELRALVSVILGRIGSEKAMETVVELSQLGYPFPALIIAEIRLFEMQIDKLNVLEFMYSDEAGSQYLYQDVDKTIKEMRDKYYNAPRAFYAESGFYRETEIWGVKFRFDRMDHPYGTLYDLLLLHFGNKPLFDDWQKTDMEMQQLLDSIDYLPRPAIDYNCYPSARRPFYHRAFSSARQVGIESFYIKRYVIGHNILPKNIRVYHIPERWRGDPISTSLNTAGRLIDAGLL